MAANPNASNTTSQTPQAAPQDTTTLMAQLNTVVGDTLAAASGQTQATIDAANAAQQAAFARVAPGQTTETSTGGAGVSADSALESPITLEDTKASRSGTVTALDSLQRSVRGIEAATAASRASMDATIKKLDAHEAAKVIDIEQNKQLEVKKLEQAATVDARTAEELKALQIAHAKSQQSVARLQDAIAERKMFTLGLDKDGNPLKGAKKAQYILTGLFGFNQMNALSQQANQDLVTAMAYTTQLEQEINTKFSQAALEKDLLTAEEAKATQAQLITGANLQKQFAMLQTSSERTNLLTAKVGMHKEDSAALNAIYNANADLYKTDIGSWQALYQYHQARSLAREIKTKDELRAAIHAVSVRDKEAGGPGMSDADVIVAAEALWGVKSYEQYMTANPVNGANNISKILNGVYNATQLSKQDPATQYALAQSTPADPASQAVLRTYDNYLAQPQVQNSIQTAVAWAAGAITKDKEGNEVIDMGALQQFLGTQQGQMVLEQEKRNALRSINLKEANASNFYQSGGMVISKQDLKQNFTPEEVDVMYKYIPPAWITGSATSPEETKKATDRYLQNLQDAEKTQQLKKEQIMKLLTWTADTAKRRNELFARKNLALLNGSSTDATRFDLPIQVKGPGGLIHSVNLTRPEDLMFLYNTKSPSFGVRVRSDFEARRNRPASPFPEE